MPKFIKIRDFSGGLYIGAPEDEIPQGALRRARGIHPISRRSARSRFGGSVLHSLNATKMRGITEYPQHSTQARYQLNPLLGVLVSLL